jgi:hypothetical protein
MPEMGFNLTLPASEAGITSASDKAGHYANSAVTTAILVLLTGAALMACGGGGGASSPAPASSAPSAGGDSAATVSIAGQAIKGPVVDGKVCAYTLQTPRQQIACTQTDANANYQLSLPAGTAEVLLEVTGGNYIDEATGQKVALSTPLRTLSKAGGPIENVLMTPFTELAVQLASKGGSIVNAGGNLSLSGFQTQIGNLEAGMGITGLAAGYPFGGKSSADVAHQKALEAFSKQQNSLGKDVGGTLQLIGADVDKCGIASVGVSLAAYGAVGSTLSKAAGGMAAPALAALAPDLMITADMVRIDTNLPSSCKDTLVIDGVNLPFVDLKAASPPAAWQNAKSVEITQCTGRLSGTLSFPAASMVVHVPDTSQLGNVSITSLGGFSLAGAASPIDLTKSGISLNTATGCLLLATGSKSGIGSLTIVASSVGSGSGIATTSGASGNVGILLGGTATLSGGGSIAITGLPPSGAGSAGGVVVTGGFSGSGTGGLSLTGGKAP